VRVLDGCQTITADRPWGDGRIEMAFRIESRHLGGVVVLVPDVCEDERGFFMETFHADQFRALGLPSHFPQDNQSRSRRGVIRGLHFQWDPPMGKLMRVTSGNAFLVAVDIRKESPTLGKWFGLEVSADSRKQIWAPPGFARGFCALSDCVDVQYKCTGTYSSQAESGIRWNDPAVGVEWPVSNPVLSEKDRNARTLGEWLATPESENFRYP
jgi:dTDP-4-dehydrorhamnose 3,5-epimerase